ncbi:MAG: response regulator transcription factor [Salinarimonas sp.]|nr:response regulator transcription factor [Salinarimonas sp.]
MRIVLVEDNALLARGIIQALGDEGHAVDWLSCGEAGAQFIATQGCDLAILDINLPGRCGITVLREIRGRGECAPVIMLTARTTLEDRISGLDAGADDYLTKPFEMAELAARVRALARRRGTSTGTLERIGALEYDRAGRRLIGPQGALELPRREFALFAALFDCQGRVLSKNALCDQLYGTGADIETNAVELLVSRLRRKLAGTGICIRTLRGLGYVMQETDSA